MRLRLARPGPAVAAAGAWYKNAVCGVRGDEATLSAAVGDLDTPEACVGHDAASDEIMDWLGEKPAAIACDPAKTKPYQPGVTAVAVPWKMEETRVLRNLGFNVPSPISQLYDWPGRVKPFNAQRDTASFLTLHERAFVLNEIGTGKTLAALWAYDYLRHAALATRLLVVSPLSTLERTWADEIFNHFPHLTTSVLHGTRVRRANLLAGDADIYLINHDGVKVLADS